ncbi:hypothetical protein [Helicobacter sp. MIT 99-5507]|uniref:hypothetical protein n=1 Tax=Helicobacter sp. MIT 99-5507 TaxID=152489 RepID=UPI000E1E9A51|nr:hypothetical protein [Helicobacter sp. MIT 99-5507]RDU57856.1 hypothetical protein CQA42_02845 [Helicobacter sp. MIT 99-5507]
MIILVLSNIIIAFILAIFDIRYLYSFEISFVCSMLIFFFSFQSMQKKVHTMTELFKNNLNDDEDVSMSKKEKFFIGTRISFGIFRILSYVFLGFCIVGLINNKLFFIIPFIVGTATSSIAMAFWLLKDKS